MEQILIVEDELIVARDIQKTLERSGYRVSGVARDVEKALLMIKEKKPTLVLVDIFLKGILTGIDLANQLNSDNIPFIYISANSNQMILEAAKQTHPYGFIVKPFREKDLLVSLDIARYRYRNNEKMQKLNVSEQPIQQKASTNTLKKSKSVCTDFIGKSAPMLQVFKLIQQVAPFDTSVLILGETGTGKEITAECIHRLSERSNKPFLKINCAAIPDALMEAELFGYEKGAFTGATDKKAGKFELADGGTLLLDEIGEMPMDMQAKLLRVLQEKELQRLGGHNIIKADVRIIAATNKNLEKEVADGKFRLDLYYRLYVFPITLPALRQRKEDIPLLVDHFIRHYAATMNKSVTGITNSSLQKLIGYQWPGNIRELQHLIERSVLMASTGNIQEITLPVSIPDYTIETQVNEEEITKAILLKALIQCEYKVSGKGGVSELLNLPPTTIYNKIKKFGIEKKYSM